jgi:hypothetical protein
MGGRRRSGAVHRRITIMSKRARRRRARKGSAANHGRRPNS